MAKQIKLIDYIVIILSILSYAIIGIYFGCFGSKQKSAREYIYGKRSLKAIPIGLSIYSSCRCTTIPPIYITKIPLSVQIIGKILTIGGGNDLTLKSSSVSAISLMGVPQEIYIFGGQYFLHIIGAFLSLVISWTFVIPVFNGGNKKFKAPYEYFEYRFNKHVRFVCSFLYVVNTLSYIPIVLFTCCLPVSEATGIDVRWCAAIFGGICVIYTMLGGFTTVVWTDVVQAILMLSTLLFLVTASVIKAGDFKTIWAKAQSTGRTNFDFDPNPFKRLSVWSLIFGTMFNYAAHQGCSASTLQRYLSVETEKHAKLSVLIGICGSGYNTLVGTIVAFCMVTIFNGCDPVANKEIISYNQLAPNFALEILSVVPGLSGVLIAGLLSAGLSTMSAELNTISGMIYYDYIHKNFKRYKGDKKGAFIMKLIVLTFGLYFVIMVSVVQKIKYIIAISFTFAGASNGLTLGLLILGSAFPKTNTKGALVGITLAGIFMSWLAINATIYNVGAVDALPVSTENCTHTNYTILKGADYFNYTTLVPILDRLSNTEKPEVFFMYKLSFLYYTMFGCIITICISLIVSYATGGNDIQNIDEKLLIACVRPKRNRPRLEELQDMLKQKTNN